MAKCKQWARLQKVMLCCLVHIAIGHVEMITDYGKNVDGLIF